MRENPLRERVRCKVSNIYIYIYIRSPSIPSIHPMCVLVFAAAELWSVLLTNTKTTLLQFPPHPPYSSLPAMSHNQTPSRKPSMGAMVESSFQSVARPTSAQIPSITLALKTSSITSKRAATLLLHPTLLADWSWCPHVWSLQPTGYILSESC